MSFTNSILAKIIASAIYDSIKSTNTDQEKSKTSIDLSSQEMLPSILEGIEDADLQILNPYLNDEFFRSYLTSYLTDLNKIKEISVFLDERKLTLAQSTQVYRVINQIKQKFQTIILQRAEDPSNNLMIQTSVNTIIPDRIAHNQIQLATPENFSTNTSELKLRQLQALLDHQVKIFEDEKMLYGDQGVNVRLIAEISRLENNIEKIINT